MKLTIAKKLYTAFFVVLLFLGVTGYVGIQKMGSIDTQTTNITTSWMPGVESINKVDFLIQQVRTLQLQIFAEPDQTKIQSLSNQEQQDFSQIDQTLSDYEKTIYLKEDRKNFTALKQQWSDYKSLDGQFVELGKTVDLVHGAADKGPQVVNLIRTSESKYALMQESMNALVKLNHDGALQSGQDGKQTYLTGRTTMWITIIIALFVAFVLAFFITRSISKPLVKMGGMAERISNGDLTVDQIRVTNKDEIGKLATAFNSMIQNLRDLIHQVNMTIEQVASSSEKLTASAQQTSLATEQVAETMQEVATDSEKQVQSLQESATTVAEMSAGIQQIATSTQDVATSAVEASEIANEGNQSIQSAVNQMNSINNSMQQLEEAIKRLGDRSQEIDGIISVITDISSQTNLLALNAAIEAARAGEHGRGFAVVADEVRKLAEQSTHSAEQITQLIAAIQTETNTAVQSMNDNIKEVTEGTSQIHHAGEAFSQIHQAVSAVANQVGEVSSAVQQMSAGAQEVNHSIAYISGLSEEAASATQTVSAAAEEQLASMEEISSSSASLARMAEELQVLVSKFKL